MKRPPQQRGVSVQPETKAGKKSQWSRIPTSHTRAETPVEQMSLSTPHTVQNYLIMNFKSTLMNRLACLGISPPKLVNYPPAGRLVHYQQNWLKVTQDRWVLNTIQGYLIDFSSTCNTSLSTILCRPDSADFRGSNRVTTEGSNRGNSTCRTNRVLFKPFSCPQEGWRTMASNQSQSPKQFCEQGTFQNGGHSYTERSPEKGGLAGQNRYERCLLFNTHSPKPQKIPQVYVQREDLPIQLPTIRPILSPMGVYKNSKTSTSDSPERGVRLIAYIDHLLLLVESKDLITDQVTGMRHLLECLGFIVNTK